MVNQELAKEYYAKKEKEYELLEPSERHEIMRKGVCFMCGGTIRTIGIGQEGWETYCVECNFLYDED